MVELLTKECFPVRPELVMPVCYRRGERQDCFHCLSREFCRSPMSFCVRPYPRHQNGCPNYGKKDSCAPNMPFFSELFDLRQPVLVIATSYDLKKHVDAMRKKHPDWSADQLRCVLYWQRGARKQHREYVSQVYSERLKDGFFITDTPEAMGMDVTKTVGGRIKLEWPCVNVTWKISIAGRLLPHMTNGMVLREKVVVLTQDGFVLCKCREGAGE